MGTAGAYITSAEIAELAGVALSTVSNWRRRHKSFPGPEKREGREYYLFAEVAQWLDGREVAKNDLRPGESKGVTYGERLRDRDPRTAQRENIVTQDSGRQKEAVWKELGPFRGTADIAAYADLVLGLLYLAGQEPDRWSDILAAGRNSAQSTELAILEHRPALLQLHRSWRSVLLESRGEERFDNIVRVIDRVTRRPDSAGDEPRRWVAEVFEYLLSKFAAAEGRRGAVVISPRSVVRVLAEVVALQPGESLLDPCSDAGSFILGAAKYVEAHGGLAADVSFAIQPLLERSWSIAWMNLALHGVAAAFAPRPGLALNDDMHAGKRFDAIVANPPFNLSNWADDGSAERHWPFGVPPRGNANFGWLQHAWSALADNGRAAVIMPNGATSSNHSLEGRIRARMVDEGAVEALIALPSQLFSTTAIPVTVWLLRRSAETRSEEILFIDARALGAMVNRSQRDLADDDVHRIASTLTVWRDRRRRGEHNQDQRGFTASEDITDVRRQTYVLMPGRYVRAEVATNKPTQAIPDLRRDLDDLHRRAIEADAAADRQLGRIETWIR
jgi:type I restriction enzyme M protein